MFNKIKPFFPSLVEIKDCVGLGDSDESLPCCLVQSAKTQTRFDSISAPLYEKLIYFPIVDTLYTFKLDLFSFGKVTNME